MDDKDRQLLGFLRKGITLTSRPFQDLASKTGADSDVSEIFLRLINLRDQKAAGPLTAVLDSQNLVYQNIWAAAKLPGEEKEFEKAAAAINAHPGVIKSHRRDHDFNFWFTLVIPLYESAEDHFAALSRNAGNRKILALPAVKRFKAGQAAAEPPVSPRLIDFSNLEIEVLRKIQEDLPLQDRPFQKWARDLDVPENDFLEILKKFTKQGILKRFAMLMPAEERLSAPQNMSVWQVPEEKQDAIAACISSFPGVTQCVRRHVFREFPYSLYAFHAGRKEEAEETALEIQKKIGGWPRVNVPAVSEFKNSRPFYFPRDLEQWSQSPEKILKEV